MNIFENFRYFEWDFFTWERSRTLWDKVLLTNKSSDKLLALELGGRHGGISLYLASEYNIKIICSDLRNEFLVKAKKLHELNDVEMYVSYKEIDALDINLPDNSIDIVVFKSLIGALGCVDNQRRAIEEIYRILKPGGQLLFAENIQATKVHMFLRKIFRKYRSNGWYYPSYYEFVNYLNIFSISEVKTTGFTAVFSKNIWINLILSRFDLLFKLLPANMRYVIYGYSIK